MTLLTLSANVLTLLGSANYSAFRSSLGLGAVATLDSITISEIAAALLVTASETIEANNNDTTIPTSAAVAALVAAGWESRSQYNRVVDIVATTREESFEDGYDYLVLGRGMSRTDTAGLAMTCVFESINLGSFDTEVLTIPLGVAASAYSIVIEIPDPRSFQNLKRIMYSSSVNAAGSFSVGAQQVATYGLGGGPNNARIDRLNSISIDLPAAIDAGSMSILRRRRT
ncbi:MAG: hypothetical protein HC834_03290 [Rhodospirillales bacterium]|nr:hypothetical protein [Rhodospirillales bacterium]